MAGGRPSYQKGSRFERALVRAWQEGGFAADRTPLSGAARGKFGGYDISLPLLGIDRKVEVKHHATGFLKLYKWLEPVDMLMVRADRSEPLVIMPLSLAIELAATAEKSR